MSPATSSLLALQEAMQAHLLHDDDDAIAAWIAQPAGGLPVARRLHVYHHAYRMRLVDALRDAFGHTATYLGADIFEAEAMLYARREPSTSYNLNQYGAGFSARLQERYPDNPEAGELAALDWALRRAFDGPDAPALDLPALGAVAPDAWSRIGLRFVPTCTRLRMRRNTLALWHALDQDQALPEAQDLPEPAWVLVWRRGHQPHFRSLGALEALALDRLIGGAGFAATCTELAAAFVEQDIAATAGTLLRRWIDEQVLAAIVEPAPCA